LPIEAELLRAKVADRAQEKAGDDQDDGAHRQLRDEDRSTRDGSRTRAARARRLPDR